MTMHVRFRHQLLGGHRHVRVFIGKDVDHLQKSGDLVFREDEQTDEWTPFRQALGGRHGVIEVDDIEEHSDRSGRP